jgi:hypothetical protein
MNAELTQSIIIALPMPYFQSSWLMGQGVFGGDY